MSEAVKRIEGCRGPIPDAVVNLAHRVRAQLSTTHHRITWARPTSDEGIQMDTQSGMGIEVSRHGN